MAPAPATEPREYTGVMHVIDATGDSRHEWNHRNSTETETARSVFSQMKSKGYAAYKTRADGSAGELLQEFDPQAEKIIFRPPFVGG